MGSTWYFSFILFRNNTNMLNCEHMIPNWRWCHPRGMRFMQESRDLGLIWRRLGKGILSETQPWEKSSLGRTRSPKSRCGLLGSWWVTVENGWLCRFSDVYKGLKVLISGSFFSPLLVAMKFGRSGHHCLIQLVLASRFKAIRWHRHIQRTIA